MSGSLPVGGVDLAAPSGSVAPDADLVVRGLRKTYQSPPVRALRGVDITVRRGEFVALMGPSGSGKSTLLHLIAGLDSPDEGTVAIAGVRTEELSTARLARLRRRHVGLVFQFFHLIEHMSALENVALAALVAGAKPTDATERARTLLDTLGLLESDGQAEVLELFSRLHQAGRTILMVTHSNEVAGAAQRVVRMRDGQILDPAAAP